MISRTVPDERPSALRPSLAVRRVAESMEKPPLAFPVAFPGNATTIVAFHVFVKFFFGEFTLRSSVTVFLTFDDAFVPIWSHHFYDPIANHATESRASYREDRCFRSRDSKFRERSKL